MTTSPIEADTLVTVKWIANRWGVMLKAVYAVKDSGDLPAIILGPKTIRFRLEDVLAYEAAHRTPCHQPLVDEKTLAALDELADDAPPLSQRQQDTVRAAFKGRR